MKRILRLILTIAMLMAADVALAKGGGKGSMPAPPPPPPAPPVPAQQKAPEAETYSRRNRRSGQMGNAGTMLTMNNPEEEEAGIALGGNTLLGS